MTRLARGDLFTDNKYFHILSEGLFRENIFEAESMKDFYCKNLEKLAQESGVRVLAFSVGQNSAHILATAAEPSVIPEFMRRLNTVYAKFYNRVKGRSGYVFKGRYESEALRSPDEILDCIAFIHNQAVSESIAENPAEYEFSSAAQYAVQKGFVDFDDLKRLFKKVPNLSEHNSVRTFKTARPSEDCDSVLMDLIARYNITDPSSIEEPELLRAAIYELKTRSGVSLRDIAILLGVDREKIRRTAKDIKFDSAE